MQYWLIFAEVYKLAHCQLLLAKYIFTDLPTNENPPALFVWFPCKLYDTQNLFSE